MINPGDKVRKVSNTPNFIDFMNIGEIGKVVSIPKVNSRGIETVSVELTREHTKYTQCVPTKDLEIYSTTTKHQSNVVDNKSRKNDSEKIRLDLIPQAGINGMGRAFTFGATKYSPDNWAQGGFEWRRLVGAAMRHITAFNSGEDNDPESGLCHIDHALACLAMLNAHVEENLGTDDRRKVK